MKNKIVIKPAPSGISGNGCYPPVVLSAEERNKDPSSSGTSSSSACPGYAAASRYTHAGPCQGVNIPTAVTSPPKQAPAVAVPAPESLFTNMGFTVAPPTDDAQQQA